LEKYKDLAEKYGYILAGSNNSKNGMSWEQNHPQIKIFMEDVRTRLNIDAKRVYTCGFSGGSRVACSIAIFDGGINCVIGMGAGLPNLSEPIHNKFDYIGFAGNEDFNMNEMIGLTSSMDKSPIRHQLIIFNGKHEWAPADVAEDAFVWIQANAMKDGLISKNDTLIRNYIQKVDAKIKYDEGAGLFEDENILSCKLVNYFDGLADVSRYVKFKDQYSNSKERKEFMELKDKIVKEEMGRQENYRNSFVLKDLAWWTSEISKLKKAAKTNNSSETERVLMNKRLLGYLSLVAYMNANSAFESRQYELMEKFLKIYQMADPENSEHQYLFADLYAIKKDNVKALSSLKNAIKLGFNDVPRLEGDTSLAHLKESPEYKQLLENLRSGK
jgi:hypothetical protein